MEEVKKQNLRVFVQKVEQSVVVTLSVLVPTLFLAVIVSLLLRKNVTGPIIELEKKTREFALNAQEAGDVSGITYEAPVIRTGNEIQSLAETLESMTKNLKENAEKTLLATRRAIEAERENELLAEKARSAERIAKLSETVSALLDNMPVMSFCKDIETGVYLMCNQSFAEYCNKEDPSEVIGKTDFDMYDEETAKTALAEKSPWRAVWQSTTGTRTSRRSSRERTR